MADPENRIIAVNSNASSDVEKFSGKDGASSSIDIRGSTVDNNSAALAKTWKKIDYVVLPIVAMFYLLSFLDRTNLANARVAGLQDDLKLTNYQYCIALTVTFIPYIAIEIPSNLVLKSVGPSLMLPTMLTLWGIVTTLQGVVKSYPGLLACRFFLGLFEGGVYPGIVLYLSLWYPRQQLQRRISTFFSAASLSGAFSGILAYGIITMDGVGHRPGWAWIFILEGLFTFLFGLSSFFILPSSPSEASFLSKEEKEYVETQLRETGATGRDENWDSFSWKEFKETFTIPHMWLISLTYLFNGTQIYGLAYFTPSVVKSLGYTAAQAQLFSVPPFAAAFVVTILGAYFSDRYGARGGVIIFSAILSIVGYSMFLVSPSMNVKWGSLFLTISGAYTTNPTLATWNANNTAAYTRRATSIAFAVGTTNFGGIFATWLFGTLSTAPLYRNATITLLAFSVMIIFTTATTIVYLNAQNRRKALVRETSSIEDEKPGLGDRSAWFVYTL